MSLSKHSSKSSPLSSLAIGYNEDLMTIIFLHLPVKSVLRCKCVCKQWQSLASNPQFCHQHVSLHSLNTSPSGLLIQRDLGKTFDFEFCSLTGNKTNSITSISSFDYLNSPANGSLSLLCSWNGLLLFQSIRFPDLQEYYVCNPSTKKYIRLALPNYLSRLRDLDANLAFDPCVSPHYKVVFLWKGLKYRYCIAIYSSETKTYGKLSDSFPISYKLMLLQGSGIFCNGKIYWHVDNGETSLSFDIEQGCFEVFQLPPWYSLCQPIHCFGASRGRLYAVLCANYGNNDNTYVYELNEGDSGWVLMYEVGFAICNFMLSYIYEEQDEGSTLLHLSGSGNIVAYNLKEKKTNKVCDVNPLFNSHNLHGRYNQLYERYEWSSGAYQWIETLSCV